MGFTDTLVQQGYYIWDSFLPTKIFEELHSTLESLYAEGFFKHAKIGQNAERITHSKIRNDSIFWLDENSQNTAIQSYFSAVHQLRQSLNQQLFLGIQEIEAHFAIYPAQSFYRKHIDQFHTNKDRKISCVYYLNKHWSDALGGALKLYDTNDVLLSTISPIENRLVCFKSDMPHEVETCYAPRYSIASWFKVRAL